MPRIAKSRPYKRRKIIYSAPRKGAYRGYGSYGGSKKKYSKRRGVRGNEDETVYVKKEKKERPWYSQAWDVTKDIASVVGPLLPLIALGTAYYKDRSRSGRNLFSNMPGSMDSLKRDIDSEKYNMAVESQRAARKSTDYTTTLYPTENRMSVMSNRYFPKKFSSYIQSMKMRTAGRPRSIKNIMTRPKGSPMKRLKH